MPEASLEKEPASIRVDPQFWKKVRIKSIEEDMSISDFVEKGLSFWMDALESKDEDDSVLAAIIHKHLHSHNTSDADLAEADRIAEKHGKGQRRK